MSKEKNWEKTGPFATAKGTLVAAKYFTAAKGCLAAARPKGHKRPPQVCKGVALLCPGKVLRRSEVTIQRGKKFRILFQKPRIHTPIVWGP